MRGTIGLPQRQNLPATLCTKERVIVLLMTIVGRRTVNVTEKLILCLDVDAPSIYPLRNGKT